MRKKKITSPLGAKLQEARDKAGLTRVELGDKIGVGKQGVYYYESGKTVPDIATIKKISEITGSDYHKIIEEDTVQSIHDPSPEYNSHSRPKIGHGRPWSVIVAEHVGAGVVSIEDLEKLGKIAIECSERIDYALKVKGHSMEPDIHDGGLLFVQDYHDALPNDGDIAICKIDAAVPEWTTRKVYIHRKRDGVDAILKSSNGKKRIIPYDREKLNCIAKVINWINDPEEIRELLRDMEPIN